MNDAQIIGRVLRILNLLKNPSREMEMAAMEEIFAGSNAKSIQNDVPRNAINAMLLVAVEQTGNG